MLTQKNPSKRRNTRKAIYDETYLFTDLDIDDYLAMKNTNTHVNTKINKNVETTNMIDIDAETNIKTPMPNLNKTTKPTKTDRIKLQLCYKHRQYVTSVKGCQPHCLFKHVQDFRFDSECYTVSLCFYHERFGTESTK